MENSNLIKKEREFVIPGEEIIHSTDYLPGRNCFRNGEFIISKKVGIVSIENRVISVIPLNSIYIPHPRDMVIGEVIDIQSNGWVVDIDSPNMAFMPLAGVREFIRKDAELSRFYAIGDIIYAKVHTVSSDSIYLSMQDIVAKKLRDGIIVKINPAKVPRVIGKQGSMINIIKDKTGCKISVGQNGYVWIFGEKVNIVKKALELIEKESFVEGLTDKVSEMLDKEMGIKPKELEKRGKKYEKGKKK